MRNEFIFVEAAFIEKPNKLEGKFLISVDSEWCPQIENENILNNFFYDKPFDNHPNQVKNLNTKGLVTQGIFLIVWGVLAEQYNLYYKDRFEIENDFLEKNIDCLVCIGYDVCTYSNATVMKYGLSPFNNGFSNISILNNFGLFPNEEVATECCYINNEYAEKNNWYPVQVFMDKTSFHSLRHN